MRSAKPTSAALARDRLRERVEADRASLDDRRAARPAAAPRPETVLSRQRDPRYPLADASARAAFGDPRLFVPGAFLAATAGGGRYFFTLRSLIESPPREPAAFVARTGPYADPAELRDAMLAFGSSLRCRVCRSRIVPDRGRLDSPCPQPRCGAGAGRVLAPMVAAALAECARLDARAAAA